MLVKNRYNRAFTVYLLLLVAFFSLVYGGRPARAQSYNENISIVMLIDVSGSMRYTDPEMLRETAAQIFIDLLSPEDYLGVITFDHTAEVVIPLQQVRSSAIKERFKDILSAKLTPRGDTDFNAALEAAYAQLAEAETGDARPVVVLLTDGEPDPDPARRGDTAFMASYMDSLWKLVNRFALDGYPVYTVGFSEEIDSDFIRKISMDTKGEYYILKEPKELVVSFFELLGILKNRCSFIQETFELRGDTEAFPFTVDEYVRQVNLVAVNLTGTGGELEVIPPRGAGELHGTTTENRENYSLVIIYEPGEKQYGKWQAALSGSGEIRVMGDMDLHIKAWLEEPVPYSSHPINEPIHFRVNVTGGEHLKDVPLKVDVQVKKPGEAPVRVPLVEDGEYFTGRFEKVNRTGTYELLTRVSLDGQLISTHESRVHIKVLPVMKTDFWGDQDFRLGEELLVTASLQAGGKRLADGRDLEVDSFELLLVHESGERSVIPLYDSGDPEHGDVRAGDGFWSNRVLFEHEGKFRGSLMAAGRYMDAEFMLDKNLEHFQVRPAGNVFLSLPRKEVSAVPGGAVSIPLEIRSQSPFREMILLDHSLDFGRLARTSITVDPGETKKVDLEIDLFGDLETGNYTLPLSFKAEQELTVLEPGQVDVQLAVLTSREAFFSNFYGSTRAVIRAAFITAAAVLLFVLLGLLFYRFMVYPRARVGGFLRYQKVSTANPGNEPLNKLKLWKARKKEVVVTFNGENREADYNIEGGEFPYDIVIRTVLWEGRSPAFLQGWKAVIEKNVLSRTILRCTPPGIIEHNGEISTEKELFHGDSFESGGFLFEYNNPYDRWFKEKGDGIDILQDRMQESYDEA